MKRRRFLAAPAGTGLLEEIVTTPKPGSGFQHVVPAAYVRKPGKFDLLALVGQYPGPARDVDDGVFVADVDDARGSPGLPVSETERMAKLDDCARGILDGNGASAVKDALSRFESLDDVSALTRHLHPG